MFLGELLGFECVQFGSGAFIDNVDVQEWGVFYNKETDVTKVVFIFDDYNKFDILNEAATHSFFNEINVKLTTLHGSIATLQKILDYDPKRILDYDPKRARVIK